MIASIQTFGSSASFHPHVHALVTEDVLTPDGMFQPLSVADLAAVEEVFRRLLLAALRRAGRHSGDFQVRSLAWSSSGFSVYGEPVAHADAPDRLERLARHVNRASPLRELRAARAELRRRSRPGPDLRDTPRPATPRPRPADGVQDPFDEGAMAPETRTREVASIFATAYLRRRALRVRHVGETCVPAAPGTGVRQLENEVDARAGRSVHACRAAGSDRSPDQAAGQEAR